jgi:hypothetical protein
MRKILPAALAATAVLAAASVNPAEARCFRMGHHWSCFHHRVSHIRHARFRSAAAYRYAYPSQGYGYYGSGTAGYGSSYSSAATMGPSPRGGGGP